jgi:RHS repeat-associated protein
MTLRRKGLSSQQRLTWNRENRLASVSGGGSFERYEYAPDGQRVVKSDLDATTYYINRYYEVEVENVPLAVSLAYFLATREGERIDFIWQTAQENGTAGFHLLVEGEEGLRALTDEPVAATGVSSVTPQTYVYTATTAADLFYLQEVTVEGETEQYGPFRTGEVFGERIELPAGPGAAMATVYLPIVETDMRDAPAAEAAAVTANVTYRKYYYFGNQRVAIREADNIGYQMRYLHWDQLGSTLMETYASNGTRYSERGYYAFGSDRRAHNAPLTDHRFTGQKLDGSGLYYYNARYYDPEIGQFVSPDTLVPEPGNLLDYNRYLYVRGNPLKYSDPSGHCATKTNGGRDWNDGDCWRLADTIALMWDDTDYWQNRFGDISVWSDRIAPSGVTTEFFANELDMFLNSDAGREWLEPIIRSAPPQLDLGDYSRISVGVDFAEFALTRDDLGNLYFSLGIGLHTPSVGVERGDILINITGTANPSYHDLVDIDALNLQEAEKSDMMQAALAGRSKGGSVSTIIGFAATEGQESPYHATQGALFAVPGVSYTARSWSWVVWEGR